MTRRRPEQEFQQQVIDLAHVYGWRVAHFRPARTEAGWRTAVAADGAGFPDLVLVRGPELIFAELKSAAGRPSPAQQEWIAALLVVANAVRELQPDATATAFGLAPAVDACLWRPDDFDDIHDRLRRPAARAAA